MLAFIQPTTVDNEPNYQIGISFNNVPNYLEIEKPRSHPRLYGSYLPR